MEWSTVIEAKLNEAGRQRDEKLQLEVRLHETKIKLQVAQNVDESPQVMENMIRMQAKIAKISDFAI